MAASRRTYSSDEVPDAKAEGYRQWRWTFPHRACFTNIQRPSRHRSILSLSMECSERAAFWIYDGISNGEVGAWVVVGIKRKRHLR